MKTAKINQNIIDYYYSILKSLSQDDKLELIARLSTSMKTDLTKEKNTSWKLLYGSLDIKESSEAFIEKIRKDRVFNRKEIDL